MSGRAETTSIEGVGVPWGERTARSALALPIARLSARPGGTGDALRQEWGHESAALIIRRVSDEHDRRRLQKEIDRLVFAAADMDEAASGAHALVDGEGPPRVIETGMVVAYARPFTGRSKGAREAP